MSKTIQSAICAAIFGLAIGALNADAYAEPQYSKSEISSLMRTAHTPDQYRTLAGYYRDQERQFEQKAQAEKQEMERRSVNTSSLAAKYPRPVDSSRNRYDYFTYKAEQMQRNASHYESLSSGVR